MKEWAALESGRTQVLRSLAEVVVELRSRTLENGTPDWAGRSWEYRQAAHAAYEAAGIPADAQAGIQAAIRYHVGNLLRERLTPEELQRAGLLGVSPRERIAAQRASLVADAEAGGRRRNATPSSLMDAADNALEAAQRRLEGGVDRREAVASVERLGRLLERVQATLEVAQKNLEKFTVRG